jgi:8-oxo-dGTP pyrophosphatase MutT (NUDIX family)
MALLSLVTKLLPGSVSDEPEGTQFGAIPYRIVEGVPVFLMITSRRSANWVFPKGSAIKGLSSWEIAAQETWEEAGVRGEIGHRPVGYYMHPGNSGTSGVFKIKLFSLHVTEQLDEWPEAHQRFRHWALLPQTRRLLASRQAASIATALSRRIAAGDHPPGSNRISR